MYSYMMGLEYSWPEVLYKLALLTLNMLKLITIIYALILLVNISSDVRGMKISKEKLLAKPSNSQAKHSFPYIRMPMRLGKGEVKDVGEEEGMLVGKCVDMKIQKETEKEH